MVRTQLPSERFYRRRTRTKPNFPIDRRTTAPATLDEMHRPPNWWKGGKALSIAGTTKDGKRKYAPSGEAREVEADIRSGDPARVAAAQNRLKQNFDYYAEHQIRYFFEKYPKSRHTFEQQYSQMLAQMLSNYFSNVQKNGIVAAAGFLNKGFLHKQLAPGAKREWYRFAIQRDLPGMFEKKILLRSPDKLNRRPSPAKGEIDEIIDRAGLSEIDKQVIQMLYTHDMKYKEVAEILGVSLERIRQREDRGLAKIRKYIEEHENKAPWRKAKVE